MKSNAVGGIKANKGTPKRWYAKNRVILLLIILFFPLGLTLMWKYGDWTRKTKWIITVTVGLILTLGMIGSYNAAPYITVNNAKSNKINTDNSEYLLTGDVSSMKASTLTIENKSVNLSEDSEFTYRVSLLEGDNTFHLVANNANGQTEKVLTIHRTTKAEFAARTEAEKLAAEKRALDESKKEAEAIAKAKKDSNKKTNSSCWWIFCQSDEDKASQDKLAKERAEAEARKPKHSYDEFFTWSTTMLESLYARAFGGTQADRQERWAYINSQCSIFRDIDGDGDKDQYFDKSCLQDKYKGYLKPSAFDYGSSVENGGSWICPADGEKYYSYICSRYGDLITQVSAEKFAGSGFKGVEERKRAEKTYNEIALPKGAS